MRPVQLVALLLLATGCAQAPAANNQAGSEQNLRPDPVMGTEAAQEGLMDRIERTVQLPKGASDLATYSRNYAWHDEHGVRTVRAVYDRLTGSRGAGRRWVAERDLPMVMDGGCGIVTLSYDLATQRITGMSCNGDA